MDALLERVLEAHGGLDRWKNVSPLSERITCGGPFWEFKGPVDFGTDTTEASLHGPARHDPRGGTWPHT